MAGADRYDQAVLVSRAGFADVDIVYVASGEVFADALSAGSVAGMRGSPLLLVRRESAPAGVADEIRRLTPSVVVAVGGPASIADGVLVELSRAVPDSTVIRIEGSDRHETSRRLIEDAAVGAPSVAGLIVASGGSFPDALSASSPAAHLRMPVLLVDGAGASLRPDEEAFLDRLEPPEGVVVGGARSIGTLLEHALRSRMPVVRIDGIDRFATGAAINRRAYATATRAYLASGTGFADALSGGPLAAARDAPLFVVPHGCIPDAVSAELARLSPSTITLLGGTASLGPGVSELRPC